MITDVERTLLSDPCDPEPKRKVWEGKKEGGRAVYDIALQ